MNLPNKITSFRFVLIFLFLYFLWLPGIWSKLTAFVVFTITGISDYLDGYYARKYNMVTKLGQLLDPLADKIFISAGFIAFVEMEYVSAWVVIVIISREFLITGLRLIAASGGHVLAAGRSGKHKTAYQIVALGCMIMKTINEEIRLSWPEFGVIMNVDLVKFWDIGTLIMIYIAVLLTVFSGFIILKRNTHFLVER